LLPQTFKQLAALAAETLAGALGIAGVHVGILLVDDPRRPRELELVAQKSAYEELAPIGYRQSVREGLIGRAVTTARVQWARDVSQDPHYVLVYKRSTRSELCVPILSSEGEVLGVVDVQAPRVDSFTAQQVTFVEAQARLLGAALERDRAVRRAQLLAEEGHRAAERLQVALSALATLSESMDPAETLARLESLLAQQYGGLSTCVLLRDEDGSWRVLASSRPGGYLQSPFPRQSDFLDQVAREQRVRVLRGRQLASAAAEVPAGLGSPHQLVQLMLVPLQLGSETSGIWMVAAREQSSLQEDDWVWLVVGNSLGFWLDNALVYADLRAEMRALRALHGGLRLLPLVHESELALGQLVQSCAVALQAAGVMLVLTPERPEDAPLATFWPGELSQLVDQEMLHEVLQQCERRQAAVRLMRLAAGAVGKLVRPLGAQLVAVLRLDRRGSVAGALVAVWSEIPPSRPSLRRRLRELKPQAEAVLEGWRLFREARMQIWDSARIAARMIDARDPLTHLHSERVALYSRVIAAEMGMDPYLQEELGLAALLHDIGKVAVPDAVLTKQGLLSSSERLLMVAHAEVGGNILAAVPSLAHLAPLVRHHHEWYDGSGYPDGLKGDEIPLGAAIIAVADALDAMTSRRHYRRETGLAYARREIERWCGRQFHPEVAKAALRALEVGLQRGEPWALRLRDAPHDESGGPPILPLAAVRGQKDREMAMLVSVSHQLQRAASPGMVVNALRRNLQQFLYSAEVTVWRLEGTGPRLLTPVGDRCAGLRDGRVFRLTCRPHLEQASPSGDDARCPLDPERWCFPFGWEGHLRGGVSIKGGQVEPYREVVAVLVSHGGLLLSVLESGHRRSRNRQVPRPGSSSEDA